MEEKWEETWDLPKLTPLKGAMGIDTSIASKKV